MAGNKVVERTASFENVFVERGVLLYLDERSIFNVELRAAKLCAEAVHRQDERWVGRVDDHFLGEREGRVRRRGIKRAREQGKGPKKRGKRGSNQNVGLTLPLQKLHPH